MDRMILVGEASLRRAVAEFIEHYHHERNHQGLGNRLIRAQRLPIRSLSAVERRIRLGGTLSFYHYAVA